MSFHANEKDRLRRRFEDIQEYSSFSIHKRIEGGATYDLFWQYYKPGIFQYPQADRRGCNQTDYALVGIARSLSVSTSGSKGVQR